jgi:beta-lactamase superfamily II metal-dependent hydrolase
MKLTVFQSGKGDCLLLTGADGKRVLVDGGMFDAYSEFVAPALGKLRDEGGALDVVYVSHIDQDHISGVLRMMDDEVDWRIHEFQKAGGNETHKPPAAPRPPQVKAIWHNAFHEQLKDNKGEIEDMLAASSAVLSGSENKSVKELASAQGELVTSISEAIKLTRRASPEQLGIKVNAPAKGKLMLVRAAAAQPIKLGGMRLSIIGPFQKDLDDLRGEWNEWLKKNKKALASIKKHSDADASKFSAREIGEIILPKIRQAEELGALLPLDAASAPFKLGERKKVTTPNLASLMFFVEEKKKTLLLTGDGHHLDILKGLRHTGKLDDEGGLHLDVFKVQHHASEHNIDEVFCRTVTADNYIFCGNGEHENPDLRVLAAIADSRFGKPAQLSQNPQTKNPFKFWFNSSEKATKKAEAKAHMKEVEKRVKKLAAKSGGQLSFFFLKGASFDLEI